MTIPQSPPREHHHDSRHQRDSGAFFAGPIETFDILLARAGMESLRRDPRTAVPATVNVGTNRYLTVAIHLKGAAGSMRGVDDLPGLTLNFDKLRPGQRFHGLDKLHLNNSVQDPSRMSEIVCSDLYLAAGVPTARATHALVKLNGRNLGIYVLKEGYNKTFLARYFTNRTGNLYDGGFLRDIDQDLERDSGDGPDTHADLRQLLAACSQGDLARRRDAMGRILDLERFVTYTALQVLTEDWDGYPNNRNNYRLYHDPGSGRFIFIPHGMDQMFERPGMPLGRGFEGLVAASALQIPELRGQYWDRIASLLDTTFTTNRMLANFDAAVARRLPVLASRPRDEQVWITESTADLRRRIIARVANAKSQLAGRPRPVAFNARGETTLANWRPQAQADSIRPGMITDKEGRKLLQLFAERPGAGSWRTRVHLTPGRYLVEGRGRTEKVVPLQDARGQGLGLRLSGAPRHNQAVGTRDWQTLACEFTMPADGEVEFVAELRAASGTGWFDPTAFVLRRLTSDK